MNLASVLSVAPLLLFPALMIWAGVRDLLTMQISNRLVLALLAGYIIFAILMGFGAYYLVWSVAAAAIVFFVAFACFVMGWVGGGDAKLATVAALWLGADLVPTFVIFTALIGGGLALGLLIFRRAVLPASFFRHEWVLRLQSTTSGVPYGMALAAAALLVFPESAWMTAVRP